MSAQLDVSRLTPKPPSTINKATEPIETAESRKKPDASRGGGFCFAPLAALSNPNRPRAPRVFRSLCHCRVESKRGEKCGPRMKYLLCVSFLISALALRGIAQNSEEAEKPSQSPDGKWEYRLLDLEDDQSDLTPAIVKTDTDEVGMKLPG